MWTNWITKIYYWKKSKGLKIYIIIALISIIVWWIIWWKIMDYIIIIIIVSIPLLVLLIIDYERLNNLKIELKSKSIKIKTVDEWEKEINYKDIKIVYSITWISMNGWEIQIMDQTWKIISKFNITYIDKINNLLEELYKKNIIICNINIRDSYTNNLNDPQAIFRWPIPTWKYLPVQEPYVIKREITKQYRWIPQDETEEFEKENNLIDWKIDEKKINKISKSKKKKTKKYTIIEA